MPARSHRAAVDDFVGRLRRAATCVTDHQLLTSGYRPETQPHAVSFAPRLPSVPLRATHGARGIAFWTRIDFVVDRLDEARRAYEARPIAYWYHVLDLEDRELLAFHWHPAGVSPITFPHMHLSSRIGRLDLGPGFDPVALGGMHLPTSFVTLADVVRLLITGFGIAPRRADWEDILRDANDARGGAADGS